MIERIERAVVKHAQSEHCKEYNLLQTIPGIGKVLALTKQMLNFGVARGYMSHNPAAGLRPIDLAVQEHTPGDRYLTGDTTYDVDHYLTRLERRAALV